jgi:hypothetical protein
MLPSTAFTQDEHLASLALRAATQLDRLQRNLDSDWGVVRDFADAIETYSGLGELPTTGCGFALDPISSEMFNAAVSKVIDHPINDVTSLNQEIARFVSELRDHPEKLDISRLITFCLTIHDFVLKNKTFSGLNEKGVFDYDHNYAG